MRKLSIVMFLALSVALHAKILRVSNVRGTTAPYQTVGAALKAASDGDVIMVDASPNSYGDVEINKKITLQGPGFFLAANGIMQDGQTTAEFGDIRILKEGAKVSSLSAYNIFAEADKVIITRCWARKVSIYNTNGAVIHQNYIPWEIYTTDATNAQITNNILGCFHRTDVFYNLKNSVIRYNTFTYSYDEMYTALENCVIEYNIGNFSDKDTNNTVKNNKGYTADYYTNIANGGLDSDIKKLDRALSTSYGAFANASKDPYQISGVAPGPVIEDFEVQESIEQGERLRVRIRIKTQK